MNHIYKIVILLCSFHLYAEEVVELEVPNMPLPIVDDEVMEEDITIVRKGDKVIHEYRVNGQLYKIKVIPDIGPAYYFIDPDGDGRMEEVSASDLEKGLKINQWPIAKW